ncbi:PQQ-binding-like beta-propeller repeat protein [Streptomyces sp. AS02]|uniref:protein kinase domain-containing protein n=1 Tax=Streptomyces sp. AS02 TaxID=2938946 RepID=UPI002021F954|nr:PQQ-binding-like beta-propeller repeat protein [Streptomyces sp. AS02]MCL8010467.1 serine/threonine-protein kinase [Streptomyces sp. AS02]
MPLRKDDPKSVGGYKLLDRLGAGGMGAVYRGRSRSGREVAVKVVHAQYAEDPVFRTRFRQEIEAVRKVSGAFTAPVVDADPEAVRPWMATQYVPGRSLADRLRERGPMRGAELRQLALGLVEALRDIHRAGVVHRDLKPANVLMAEDGPRVIDFGISRAAENHQTVTETGQMIGTPPFMSPEQFTDARKVGPASDVFSLGALLVFAVTGRGPFDADSPYLTAYRVVHDEPVLDGLAQPLRSVLERCLAKDVADRPELDALAREFAAVLPEPAEGEPQTVSLRLDGLKAVEGVEGESSSGHGTDRTAGSGSGSLSGRTAGNDLESLSGRTYTSRFGRRRGRRPLWAATGTVGALALGLTGYALVGPNWEEESGGGTVRSSAVSASPSASSRWAEPPEGWRAWQTTVNEKAPLGAPKAVAEGFEGDSACLMYDLAAYCAGQGVLPVRLDGLTGKTVWRADLAPAGMDGSYYWAALLGVHDGAMLVRQSITQEDSNSETIQVIALDTKTGAKLWSREMNDENVDLTLSGDVVLTADADGRTVTARTPRTGAERWTMEVPAGYYCTFETFGSDLYAHCTLDDPERSLVLAVDRTDGSVRRITVPYQSGIVGSVDGRVAVAEWIDGSETSATGSADGRLLLIDPDSATRSTTKLEKIYTGQSSLADGTLWTVSGNGRVTALSARTGKQLWQTPTSLENPGKATYDPRTRTLYVASNSGRVAALDARKGTLLWETLPRVARVFSGGTVGPEVLLNQGALVVTAPDGTVFSLDPAHPERKPVSG